MFQIPNLMATVSFEFSTMHGTFTNEDLQA